MKLSKHNWGAAVVLSDTRWTRLNELHMQALFVGRVVFGRPSMNRLFYMDETAKTLKHSSGTVCIRDGRF